MPMRGDHQPTSLFVSRLAGDLPHRFHARVAPWKRLPTNDGANKLTLKLAIQPVTR